MAGAPKVVRLSALVAVMMGRELVAVIDVAQTRREREVGASGVQYRSLRETLDVIASGAVAVARWVVAKGLDPDVVTVGQPTLAVLVSAAAKVVRESKPSGWRSRESDKRRLLHGVARALDAVAATAATPQAKAVAAAKVKRGAK